MKFRKKPVVIEAILWDGKDLPLEKAPQWIIDAVSKTPGDTGNIFRDGNDLFIYTLEGTMKANPGDWIIRGVNGELYPCKPDIFEKTYQLADESVSSLASSGWVKVEERLPEKSGVYLAYETNHGLYGEYGLEVMRFDDYNKSWFFGSDCFHPTHWMPLPVPPVNLVKQQID